jgi:membrane peptidoglycan carboxypeptidase
MLLNLKRIDNRTEIKTGVAMAEQLKLKAFTRQIRVYLDELHRENLITQSEYNNLLKDALAVYFEREITERITHKIDNNVNRLLRIV